MSQEREEKGLTQPENRKLKSSVELMMERLEKAAQQPENRKLKSAYEIGIENADRKKAQEIAQDAAKQAATLPTQQWSNTKLSAADKKIYKDLAKEQLKNSQDNMQQRWQNSRAYNDVQAKTNSQGWRDMQATMNQPKAPVVQQPQNVASTTQKAENNSISTNRMTINADSINIRGMLNNPTTNPTNTALKPADVPVTKGKGPWLMAASMAYNKYKENSEKRKEEKAKEKEVADREKLMKDQQKAEKDAINDLRKGGDGSEETVNKGLLVVVLLFSLAIHVIDATGKFDRQAPSFIIPPLPIILLYMFVALFGTLLVFKSAGERESFGIWVLASAIIIPTALNHLYNMVPNEWMKIVLGLAGWFPALSLYIISKYPQEGFIKLVLRLYYFIWTFAALAFIMTSPIMLENTSNAFSEGGIMINPMDSMTYVFNTAVKTVEKASNNMMRAWNAGIAKATGQTYSSSEEEQRGIYLESMKPVEPMYYTDSDVYVEAKLKAKNILVNIPVHTTCKVPDTAIKGRVTPEIKSLVDDDETWIDCHLGPLPAGTHAVTMTSTFTFETDSDIQYYFVDESTRPEMYKELKIPERTTAIYGGGPVAVGLLSFHQPMRISSNPDIAQVGDYSFGVRLENKWSQGKIVRGNYYILEVPNTVKLIECNRKMNGQPTKVIIGGKETDRMQYKFLADDNNLKEVFDSVSCRISIVNPEGLFGQDIVAQKTFSAKVSYEYAVEQSTTVNVGTG